ncbi:phosphoribosyltransferase family protein [Synechocystis sp. LKSZ1]|uniref:phosphoribosyltransferase n=1 Tax=Synechocystis sp. LKSZ1 TaxID=3144951 RepID=UPI00336C1D31
MERLPNRLWAGQQLADQLQGLIQHEPGLVLALPRGGVPVAYPIARQLGWPLDVCLVRKLGAPGQPELAMGAITLGGLRVINQDIVDYLKITTTEIARVQQEEEQEIARRNACYRRGLPLPVLKGKTVILVDDGVATGATLQGAIAITEQQGPRQLIVAVPVIAPDSYQQLCQRVDRVFCLLQPAPLQSIGLWYEDFSQVPDEVVCHYLNLALRLQNPPA